VSDIFVQIPKHQQVSLRYRVAQYLGIFGAEASGSPDALDVGAAAVALDGLSMAEQSLVSATTARFFQEHHHDLEACISALTPGPRRGAQNAESITQLDTIGTKRDGSGYTALANGMKEFPGRYAELGVQGRGGTGRVLIVEDSLLHRRLALKELRAESADPADPTAIDVRFNSVLTERFLREARITSRLEHPGIVPIHEVGTRPDGRPYYTMRLVRGQTLAERIAAAGSLQERLLLLPHVIDLAQTVAYAHVHGVIHRDIKPGNIMIGEFGETILLDWGLAKEIDSDEPSDAKSASSAIDPPDADMTRHGEILGTPAYMAPEQASGDNAAVGTAADIHALGAVLYAVLSGRPPFAGATEEELLYRIVHTDAPSVRQSVPGCPAELASICKKALARNPLDRQQSAREFADDLLRYQSGGTVFAHTYTLGERARKAAWQHRRSLAVGALIAIILTLAVVAYAVKTNQSNRQLDHANRDLRWENYVSLVKVAQAQIQEERFVPALETLYQTPPEHRSWEWGYLHRLTHQDVLTLENTAQQLGNDGALCDAVLSPDNRYLLTDRPWRYIRTLVDLSTGRLVWKSSLFDGSRECNQFLPDGKTLCTATGLTEAARFSVPDGRLAVRYSSAPFELRNMAFAPEKNLAAGFALSESGERCLFLWEMDSGAFIRKYALAPIPEKSKREFPKSDDAAVRRYEVTPGLLVGFTRDGQSLIVVDEMLRLIRIEDGADTPVTPVSKYVGARALENDRVAVVSGDVRVEVWDVGSLSRVGSINIWVDVAFALNPDGRILACRANESETRIGLFDVADGRRVATYSGHTKVPYWARFSDDGRLLVTTSQTQVKLWPTRPETGTSERTYTIGLAPAQVDFPQNNHYAAVGSYSPDTTFLATTDDAGQVFLWNSETATLLGSWHDHTAPVSTLSFSPDERFVGSGATDGVCVIRSTEDRSIRYRWTPAPKSQIWGIAFSPQRLQLAVGWSDMHSGDNAPIGLVGVYGVDGTLEREIWRSQDALATHLSFSPDGNWLVVGIRMNSGADGYFELYSTKTWTPIDRVGGLGEPMDIAFDRDSTRAFFAGLDFSVVGYDLESRKVRFRNISLNAVDVFAHPAGERFAVFSYNSRVVICSSRDGRELISIPDSWAVGAFSSDGSQLLVHNPIPRATKALTLAADQWHFGSLAEFRAEQAKAFRSHYLSTAAAN
jgi:serine/threonine protein kinase